MERNKYNFITIFGTLLITYIFIIPLCLFVIFIYSEMGSDHYFANLHMKTDLPDQINLRATHETSLFHETHISDKELEDIILNKRSGDYFWGDDKMIVVRGIKRDKYFKSYAYSLFVAETAQKAILIKHGMNFKSLCGQVFLPNEMRYDETLPTSVSSTFKTVEFSNFKNAEFYRGYYDTDGHSLLPEVCFRGKRSPFPVGPYTPTQSIVFELILFLYHPIEIIQKTLSD